MQRNQKAPTRLTSHWRYQLMILETLILTRTTIICHTAIGAVYSTRSAMSGQSYAEIAAHTLPAKLNNVNRRAVRRAASYLN